MKSLFIAVAAGVNPREFQGMEQTNCDLYKAFQLRGGRRGESERLTLWDDVPFSRWR